jgi:hypothetical protein
MSLAPELAPLWRWASQLADINVTGPVAVAIAGALWFAGARRAAFWWTEIFCAGAFVVAFSKVGGILWGWNTAGLGFRCVSGHAMLATAVAPVALYLFHSNASARLKAAAFVVGLAVGVTVAASRVELGCHTVWEAIAGVVLGGAVAVGFLAVRGTSAKLSPVAILVIVLAAPAWSFLDIRLSPQIWIADAARFLAT